MASPQAGCDTDTKPSTIFSLKVGKNPKTFCVLRGYYAEGAEVRIHTENTRRKDQQQTLCSKKGRKDPRMGLLKSRAVRENVEFRGIFEKYFSYFLRNGKINCKFAVQTDFSGSPGLGSREEGVCKTLILNFRKLKISRRGAEVQSFNA